MKTATITALIVLLLASCKSDEKPLPFIGQQQLVDGKEVPHTIPDWNYMRQDSQQITNKSLSNHIYIADFFFTSCPTICPRVMKEMVRLQEEFKDEATVKLISFTIDPKRDTPDKLAAYAHNIGADTDKWWFISGDKESIYDLANEYFVVAYEDADVPGGFDHSGKIILVDKEGHVRSFSEGTEPAATPKLIRDTRKLLQEYAQK